MTPGVAWVDGHQRTIVAADEIEGGVMRENARGKSVFVPAWAVTLPRYDGKGNGSWESGPVKLSTKVCTFPVSEVSLI